MTPNLEDLADRHFRPDPSGLLAAPALARQARVLIAIGAPMAETKAGQDALWMLANLLELCLNLGDGVNQAANLASSTTSIPSRNLAPLTIFGNWF